MAKTERIGVYPGTFDPTTNGHMDIIKRGARVLDRRRGEGRRVDAQLQVALHAGRLLLHVPGERRWATVMKHGTAPQHSTANKQTRTPLSTAQHRTAQHIQQAPRT